MPPDAPPPQDSDDENELELESVEHCQQHPTFDAMRLYLQSLQDMSLDDRQNEVIGGVLATFVIHLKPDTTILDTQKSGRGRVAMLPMMIRLLQRPAKPFGLGITFTQAPQ
jgi:hypothetical protein